jgi:hypothetical protein
LLNAQRWPPAMSGISTISRCPWSIPGRHDERHCGFVGWVNRLLRL